MKEEYNLDFKNFKRDYRQFYEDGTIQEEGRVQGGEEATAKKNTSEKQATQATWCCQKIQNGIWI
ncbi:MAG: hypothetical protein ACLUHA_11170 [Bacteroides stercoris]